MTKKAIYKSANGKEQIQKYYDALLRNWHQPSTQHYVETSLGKTFVIESGIKTAPAVILLHGSGSNSAMWTADVEQLSIKYHVFTIDIVGECGKSAESRPPFEKNNYSNWILEIMNELLIGTTSIIGCSLGGWIALDFAVTYPQKTEKVVLMATAGITQPKASILFWILLTSITGNWGFNKLNQLVYGILQVNHKVLEFASLIKNHYKPRTDIFPIFSNNQLGKIQSPVLFIGGEKDCFYSSSKTASRLIKEVTTSECYVIENTGHVLVSQTKKIIDFLENENDE